MGSGVDEPGHLDRLAGKATTARAAISPPIERLLVICLLVVMLLAVVLTYEVAHVPEEVVRDTSSSRIKGRAIACATLRAAADLNSRAANELHAIERRWGSCDEPGGP